MTAGSLLTKIVLTINWFLGVIYFRILNWTKVYGRIPRETGILFVSSHYTMVDSWLIGTCLNVFDILFRNDVIPYNLPDEKNFVLGKNIFPRIKTIFKYPFYLLNLLASFWIWHSKCIPVNRAAGGKVAHQKVIEILSQRQSNILLFPESRRRRQGEPIKISASVGKLIVDAKPSKIIPIHLMGLPLKGSFLPVIFRRPKIIIGQPLLIPELTTASVNGDYKKITEQIIKAIESLQST